MHVIKLWRFFWSFYGQAKTAYFKNIQGALEPPKDIYNYVFIHATLDHEFHGLYDDLETQKPYEDKLKVWYLRKITYYPIPSIVGF